MASTTSISVNVFNKSNSPAWVVMRSWKNNMTSFSGEYAPKMFCSFGSVNTSGAGNVNCDTSWSGPIVQTNTGHNFQFSIPTYHDLFEFSLYSSSDVSKEPHYSISGFVNSGPTSYDYTIPAPASSPWLYVFLILLGMFLVVSFIATVIQIHSIVKKGKALG